MRYRLVLALLLAAFAAPAFAGSKNCNSTLVTQGVCRTNANTAMYLDPTPGDVGDVSSALAALVGWASTFTCGNDAIAAGTCTQGQYGQVLSNPETKTQAANRAHKEWLRTTVRLWRQKAAQDASAATLATTLAAIPEADVANGN